MIIHYPCPGCGAEMTYDIKRGKISCVHCGREQDVQDLVIPIEQTEASDFREGQTYICPNCGGVTTTKDKETSTSCAFCGAPMILSDRLMGDRLPVRIVPFKLDRKDAEDAFKKWCKNGRFSPAGFAGAKNIQRMKGLYVPYWLFSYDTKADVNAKAEIVRSYKRGNYRITETEFYDVYRKYELSYKDIPYDASIPLEDGEMAKLEPFNFDEMQNFEMPYLAGFESSSYDLTDKEVEPQVKERVEGYVKDYARGAIGGYSNVNIVSADVTYEHASDDFIFAPIWFVDYDYHGKEYKFMMNGQTGRIAGKPPISKGKVAIWWGGISMVLFVIGLIISMII